MKHVGLNVAADPLFTAAYTGVNAALIVVTADDPGMASSQNEQDNRRYAVAAGLPMIEPSDSQEAYDFFFAAVEVSERWKIPVLFRMTTRVCHSKSVVRAGLDGPAAAPGIGSFPVPHFEHDIAGRVMIPANARPAHRRLRAKLAEIAAWGETSPLNRVEAGDRRLGIVASGVAYLHAAEAGARGRLPEDRPGQPAARRAGTHIRRRRRALRGGGGGRSGHRRFAPRRGHRRRIEARDVPLR